jgi:hypothetical protein
LPRVKSFNYYNNNSEKAKSFKSKESTDSDKLDEDPYNSLPQNNVQFVSTPSPNQRNEKSAFSNTISQKGIRFHREITLMQNRVTLSKSKKPIISNSNICFDPQPTIIAKVQRKILKNKSNNDLKTIKNKNISKSEPLIISTKPECENQNIIPHISNMNTINRTQNGVNFASATQRSNISKIDYNQIYQRIES